MALHKLIRLAVRVGFACLPLAVVSPHTALADDGLDPGASGNAPASAPKLDWADRVRQAKVYQGEPIVLIVHSAKDCVFCRRWEGSLGGKGEFESWAKTHPDVHLFIVERDAIALPETVDSYPPTVQWLFGRRQQLNRLAPGTPTFEIFVRRKILWQSYGLGSWERDVFPALKDLDGRRLPSETQ